MPSNSTLQRQRTLGGMVGIVVLAFALGYHFFPRLFHAGPVEVARRNVPALPVASGSVAEADQQGDDQLNAGPPLTLAPTAVIAARLAHEHAKLPKQLTPDPPKLRALLNRADKALAAGDLTGDPGSAATLFLQAAKDKPDSRRAAQGVIDVRSRLVAQIERDIALGNAEDAGDQLAALQQLPDSADDATRLQAALKVLTEVRPLLAKAAGLLQQGRVDQPVGHSALDVYRQVQQLDPQNAVAEQGITNVQHVVLDRALAAVAQNDFASADKVLAEAQAMFSGTSTAARRSAPSTAAPGPGARREATMVLRDLRHSLRHLDRADRRTATRILARPTNGSTDVAGEPKYNPDSPVGSFCDVHTCVHWVEDGSVHRPPGGDGHVATVPDWVVSTRAAFIHVYDTEVTKLGYRAPLSDDLPGDQTANDGGDQRLDVYLADLGAGFYGYCVPNDADRATSGYCVLDNDFAETQFGAPPKDSLRVTAAHEFFHAIQYGYDAGEDAWLMETTATWMEDQFDDSSNDNRQYLPWSQLAKPGTPLDTYSDTGFEQYGNWVFLEYLSERFGRRVVHRIWHRAAAGSGGGEYSTAAIRSVLSHHGGLPSVFGRYASANTDPTASYDEGRAYPTAGTVARSTLTRASPTVPWTTYAVPHLASVNVQASPGNGLDDPQWHLRVAVDGPDGATSPSVVVRVIRRDHRATIVEMPLSPDGSGSATVPFDSGRVRHVTVTMANASTRFTCHTDGGYSCRGTPKDPRTSFAVRLSLFHS